MAACAGSCFPPTATIGPRARRSVPPTCSSRIRALHALDPHTHGRASRPFNPGAGHDLALFAAVLRGEHTLHGFRNRHVRLHLFGACRHGPPPQRAGVAPREAPAPAWPRREDSVLPTLARDPTRPRRHERRGDAPRGGISRRLPQGGCLTREKISACYGGMWGERLHLSTRASWRAISASRNSTWRRRLSRRSSRPPSSTPESGHGR